jgi:hypothetical protein
MWTNSSPVTPEPITTKWSGMTGGGYAWRVVSTRSPSGNAQSGTRGRLPVDTTIASAVSSSIPSSVSAMTSWRPFRRPVPRMRRTPWLSSNLVT